MTKLCTYKHTYVHTQETTVRETYVTDTIREHIVIPTGYTVHTVCAAHIRCTHANAIHSSVLY